MRYGVNFSLDIFNFHAKEDNISLVIEPSDFDVKTETPEKKIEVIYL